MTEFEIAVSGEQAQLLSSRGQLTYRMAGARVQFSFDGEWKDLTPHAIIRQGDTAVAVSVENSTAVIPGHALTMVGDFVYAGVYGVSADGTVAIPTVWVRLGRLRDGAHIFYDEDALPNTPIWQTIGAQLGDISRLQTREKSNLVDAVNSITLKELGAIPAPEAGKVGQALAVAAVDEGGKPVSWNTEPLPTRELIAHTVLADKAAVKITADLQGNPISLRDATVYLHFPQNNEREAYRFSFNFTGTPSWAYVSIPDTQVWGVVGHAHAQTGVAEFRTYKFGTNQAGAGAVWAGSPTAHGKISGLEISGLEAGVTVILTGTRC